MSSKRSNTHLKKLVPKHPRTAEFVAQGLYAVNSFKELEAKISALESDNNKGAAFVVPRLTVGFFAGMPTPSRVPGSRCHYFE
jgi:hypothetical protein